MHRFVQISVCVCIALLMVVVYAAKHSFSSLDYTMTETNFSKDALMAVEAHTNLNLSENARGLHMVYIGSRGDPVFVAKMEILPEGVDTVKRQLEKLPDLDWGPFDALSEKVSWWNPGRLMLVLERKYTVKNSCAHVILCQEDNKTVLFVESISF